MSEQLERGLPENAARSEIIVEIGGGNFPIYRRSEEVSQRIKTGAKYVGVDLSEEALARINRDEVGEAIAADLTKLPFRNSSVNEMWLLNTFGGIRDNPEILPDGSISYTLSMMRFFKEIARVLTEDGKAYIGEFTAPEKEVDELPASDFSSLGLDKRVYEGEAFQEFLEDYRIRTGIEGFSPEARKFLENPSPFFLVLTKQRSTSKKDSGIFSLP